MPMLSDCKISAHLANAIRMLVDTMKLKVPGGDLGFRCPHCDEPVKPFFATKKQAAHFEHLKRNEACTHSHVEQ